MNIGLDYGGVISFSPNGWAKTVRKVINKGHKVYLVSHVNPDATPDHLIMRSDFAKISGAIDLTFSNLEWHGQKEKVGRKKASLCTEYNIEIFIDDDLEMCQAVAKLCDRCASFYIPINLWQVGQRLIDGLGKDGEF